MPPLPPVSSVVKLRLVGTKGNTPWNNILHVRYAGTAPTENDLNNWLGNIASLWGANLAPLCSTNVDLTQLDAADLSSATAASTSITTAQAGTRAGTSFPAQVCCVGSWRASLRYRGGHFRTYWPIGVTNDTLTISSWAAAFLVSAAAGIGAFRTAINASSMGTASCTLVGVSYRTGHALRPAPLVVTITGVSVHGRIDTQRRRLGKESV